MRKIVAGLFMSLDGVAESPGTWQLPYEDDMAEVINAGIAQSDAILMGRRTYLEFAQLWPGQSNQMADYMNNTPKYVVSSTLDTLDWGKSTLVTGDLAGWIADMKRQPGANIQIPGSPTLTGSLLRDGLLDELRLIVQPVVIGSGLRLFAGVDHRVDLRLVASTALRAGAISMTYEAVRR
jgi:dihydrofolate reductase